MQQIYHKYRRSIAYVTVQTEEGNESIGTAFHIGQGYFITAKHVVFKNTIIEVGITQPHNKIVEYHAAPLSEEERPKILKVCVEPVFLDGHVDDVAVFKVEEYESIPSILLSSMHDIRQSEDLALLTNVLCVGYPPIPITAHPFQVAVKSTVSSLIRMRGSQYLSYVIATMARGGFSGGPIINDKGEAIGVITDSLCHNGQAAETGFMACISISAAAELALKCGWDPDEYEYYRDIESLVTIKLALANTARLNPHAFDLEFSVYDDDRDVFIDVSCYDESIRNLVISSFSKICPLHTNRTEGYSSLATPIDNPSSILLKRAAEFTRDVLCSSGYTLVRERFTDGWH